MNWHYRSVIRILNYLVKSTHSEIAYTVHQYIILCTEPKALYDQALKYIHGYSKGTKTLAVKIKNTKE